MTISADTTSPAVPAPDRVGFRPPAWAITAGSLFCFFALWEWFGRDVNPVFGSFPSAIFEAFVALVRSGKLWKALVDSLRFYGEDTGRRSRHQNECLYLHSDGRRCAVGRL